MILVWLKSRIVQIGLAIAAVVALIWLPETKGRDLDAIGT